MRSGRGNDFGNRNHASLVIGGYAAFTLTTLAFQPHHILPQSNHSYFTQREWFFRIHVHRVKSFPRGTDVANVDARSARVEAANGLIDRLALS
jgi:hypothetical protein